MSEGPGQLRNDLEQLLHPSERMAVLILCTLAYGFLLHKLWVARSGTPQKIEFRALQVDPNTATLGQLLALPGVGKKTTTQIVKGRPYESLDQLRWVLGDHRFERVAPYLVAPSRQPRFRTFRAPK